MKKHKNLIKNKKGEAYIGVIIFLVIAVFMIAFMVQMGSVVIAKLALDDEAKQIVKVIQIEGGVGEQAKATIEDVKHKYSVDTNGDGVVDESDESAAKVQIKGEGLTLKSGTTDEYLIQLGNTFEVDLSCSFRLGFGPTSVLVPLKSAQVGVSEHYWKELG